MLSLTLTPESEWGMETNCSVAKHLYSVMNKLPIDSEGAFLLQYEYVNTQAADDSLHHKRLALAMVPNFNNPCFPIIRRSKYNEETKPISKYILLTSLLFSV